MQNEYGADDWSLDLRSQVRWSAGRARSSHGRARAGLAGTPVALR